MFQIFTWFSLRRSTTLAVVHEPAVGHDDNTNYKKTLAERKNIFDCEGPDSQFLLATLDDHTNNRITSDQGTNIFVVLET